jgi:hypothetical protein
VECWPERTVSTIPGSISLKRFEATSSERFTDARKHLAHDG